MSDDKPSEREVAESIIDFMMDHSHGPDRNVAILITVMKVFVAASDMKANQHTFEEYYAAFDAVLATLDHEGEVLQ
jgi:hypothetical protein